jgi:hypothetical protein
MSEPGTADRRIKVTKWFSPLSTLPWRSGGASALLIVIMSSFDDSMFSLELAGSSAEGSADDSFSSSSDNQASGRRVRAGQRVMPVREDGQPDPNALSDQDYSDIPSA